MGAARSTQPNFRLDGATIASLGLFALSSAGGKIGNEGRPKLKTTSDCVFGRQPIAGTFRSDIEADRIQLSPDTVRQS